MSIDQAGDRVPPSARQYAAGLACGLAAAAIWGGGAVVSRYLVTARLDPVDLTFLRYAGSIPVAAVFMFAGGNQLRLALPWRRFLVLLALAGPLYQGLVITGYRYVPAGTGALLLSGLLPVFALALASAAARSMPQAQATLGIAGIVAGLVLFGGLDPGSISPIGLAIFVLAALAWALLNQAVRAWRVDPRRLTVALAFWSVLFMPLYPLVRRADSVSAPLPDLALQVIYHGWLVAFLATGLFFAAVRWAGAQTAAIMQALSPVFSAALGASLLGETLTAQKIAGLALTIAGVLVTAWAIERQSRMSGTSALRPGDGARPGSRTPPTHAEGVKFSASEGSGLSRPAL